MIYLTEEQQKAVEAVVRSIKSGKLVTVLAGVAGSGKTTIIPFIEQALGIDDDDVYYICYTGRAALNLSRKGTPATTIHKLIYKYIGDDKTHKPRFILKGKDELPRIELIIIDEISMVGEKMLKDLLSFDIPILAVGDNAQLPPIMEKDNFLSANPTYTLTEIHRQALDNPIIALATDIRLGNIIDIQRYNNTNNVIQIMKKKELTKEKVLESDLILTSTNNTRRFFNAKIREWKGFSGDQPQIGETLICKRNNWKMDCKGIPLINGTRGEVWRIDYSYGFLDFQPEYFYNTEYTFKNLRYDQYFFATGEAFFSKATPKELFDFGYAVTVHSQQGSSSKNPIIIEEQFMSNEMHRRWLYTAITRAEESLIWVKEEK